MAAQPILILCALSNGMLASSSYVYKKNYHLRIKVLGLILLILSLILNKYADSQILCYHVFRRLIMLYFLF